MLQQSRPRQVSPLSMESNDSSFLSRYQMMNPSDNPYEAAKPQPSSPPLAQHPSGSTTGGHSRSTSSRSPGGSHMSSASSVARSSEGGNGMYSPVMSESGRSLNPRHEDALLEHYHILKGFLGASLAQDAAAKSTRARDKLLRLSPTQFHELSTDVYDELLRREDERQRRSPDVPRYLLPTKTFHPKRNQARQKLSTLPPERFKQLATDVYFELERRVPRLGGANIDRAASPAMSVASSYRGGPRGPPPGMRGPPGPPRPGSRGPAPGGRGPPPDRAQFPARSSSNDYGRPLPKTFQSNTIVPNKSTMVEGDDTEDEDPMGLSSVVGGSPGKSRGLDQEQVQALENQIAELQEKVAGLESAVQEKDAHINNIESSRQQHEHGLSSEREEWNQTRSDMERQLAELQDSAQSHRAELDQTHQKHAKREAGLRDQLEQTVNELQGQIDTLNAENSLLRLQGGSGSDESADEWRQQVEMLQNELTNQRKVTDEVRENATHFLQEMRVLSEQSEAAFEKEEELQVQIRSLQAEVEDWKTRYAKTKTELRNLKASSIGLPLQNMSRDALAARHQLLSQEGLVNDMHVTNYQMSIDELLQSARQNSADATLEKMKVVIGHVQQITNNGKEDYTGLPSPAESPNPMSPQLNGSGTPPTQATLKARVARNATGLITATRNYVSADGLSPVSLVDAAAANLTAAVVDYVKTVGVKASSTNELRHDMDMDDGFEMLPSTTHVPQLKPKAPGLNTSAPNNGNGWFSRLKGSFDSSYSNDMSPTSLRDDESEYNSYR
ncbi:hypothetical protein C1H76_8642 [Elsinoe australis]|uniref:GIT Spa2 homology (SHD) domain-containing protein n=1 Tax=Elsinoe australis TaxID=40998 RepID=A0A4U7AMA4_9PEZI|nr:hypothetical protein C1H76_8642 [Elsinoe australis]